MSAIVLAALVIMWAVVLVPMFLRRHERSAELAGATRFAGAMHVLARRRGHPAPPSGEQRAAAISQALSRAPSRERAPVAPASAATSALASAAARRSARVAARRRGLALMLGLIVVSAGCAVLLGGWLVWLQLAVDLVALAGLAQLRASAISDRYERTALSSRPRPAARLTTAPVTAHVSRAAVASPRAPAGAASASSSAAPAAGRGLATNVVSPPRRVARQIVFDAVSETPIVEKPRVRKDAAPTPVKRVAAAAPDDFYDHPDSPLRPEVVHVPLLDAVDTDPDTMTRGLELLDGILDRASGQ